MGGARKGSSRNLTERGYDDPTAHCFPAGVPRSMYVPAAFHIIQTPDYIVFLHERMSWRIVPLDRSARTFPTPCVCGRAIPWADGRATRW